MTTKTKEPPKAQEPITGRYSIGVRRYKINRRLMYNIPEFETTSIEINSSTQGEPIEIKIDRILNNKEPITDGAPLIFTERKEGIRASTNIKTDRWEIAVEGTDKIAKSYQAKREERGQATAKAKDVKKDDDGGAKPIEGTQQS